MKVRVRTDLLPSMLRACDGVRELEVQLKQPSVSGLVNQLVSDYGNEMADILLDAEGELEQAIQLVINDGQWVSGDRANTELREGDLITFLLILAGG